MTEDFKQKFNEVSRLCEVMDTWGDAAVAFINEAAFEAIQERAETAISKGEYNPDDYKTYQAVRKNGPDALGYEKSTEVLMNVLRQADANVSVAVQFMNAAQATWCLPDMEDIEDVKSFAKKHNIKSLQNLIP